MTPACYYTFNGILFPVHCVTIHKIVVEYVKMGNPVHGFTDYTHSRYLNIDLCLK